MNLDYYSIGQRIRKYRKAHSFSQETLSEKIGISTTHMSHIETGNTKLSLAVLVNLSFALEVTTDDILFGTYSANRNTLTENLLNELEQCTPQQLNLILDVVQALKISLSKHY